MMWPDPIVIEDRMSAAYLRSFAASDRDLDPWNVLQILAQAKAAEKAREIAPYGFISVITQDQYGNQYEIYA